MQFVIYGDMLYTLLHNRMMAVKKIPFAVVKLLNTLFVMIPFVFVWFRHYEPLTLTVRSKQVSCLLLVLYAGCFYYFGKRLDGFQVSTRRIGEMIFSQMIAVGVADTIAAIMIWMLSIHFPNLLPGLICCAVQWVMITLVCFVTHRCFFAVNPPRKAVVVYDLRQGMEELIDAYGMDKRYTVLSSYPIEEVIGNLGKLDAAEDVFLCGIHSSDRNVILKYCVERDIRVNMIPRVGDVMMSGAQRMHMFHLPFIRATRYNPPPEFLITKRLFDIVVSGLALVVLSPLMLIVTLLVKSDGGPAFYQQVRLTKDGKQFKILKFRSMCVDAEKHSGAVLSAGENDPRITKVGRFIRAYHLDELPQLINIFAGDMSVVGPRPERPEIAAKYMEELPEFSLRLQAKAGLTGYAQVYGKYHTTPYDKLLMDLMYIAHPSLLEDLTILLETIKILLAKERTEDVSGENAAFCYEKPGKTGI